ncbi:OsmC family protein [Bdellovibrio sp. 22V]|uniref:OsmC family protein n=1 Tax=Bdellovibrio TaxID=958 RepID=UPI002542F378|nr:OsmC family protein [Bdellovibrio sp. 22V]WII73828.1 OsmC family protein [Bdellovibrio sp. 22V]
MTIESAKLIEGFTYEINTGNFQLRTDVAKELGGQGSAPSPHDYLEVALASCTAITLQMYAKRKSWPLENVDVKVQIVSEGAENKIARTIKLAGPLSAEQKQMLTTIAEKCPIHRFLSKGAVITTNMIEA